MGPKGLPPAMLEVYLTDPGLASPEYLMRMATFVRFNHPHEWSIDSLSRCWLMEVTYGPYVAALMWFNSIPGGAIEGHACVGKGWSGRWLTRPVLDRLFHILDHTKAPACVMQVTSPLVARICRRLGFTIHTRIAILTVKDTEHGS